ncbi:MAG: hypothetical protein ACD_66C00245G0003 [uncultured bacterium]|nr:MAG: hypothetical protein ACD_66C00245G0003 [uncultured bacterium]
MTQIKQIFEKDIHREIKGVIKVSDEDLRHIWQELDEYVVTDEIKDHLQEFFDDFAKSLDKPTDNMAAWISGFFGSGKSHFIKILSYLLKNDSIKNPDTGEQKTPFQFFEDKLTKQPLLLADIKKGLSRGIKPVLFNIATKAGDDVKNAVLHVFFKVFNEIQGFNPDRESIAELERQLEVKGKYQKFKEAYKLKTNKDWEIGREDWSFEKADILSIITTLLSIDTKDNSEEWFRDFEKGYNPTVELFAKRVREYLDRQGEETHIIFMVDEVGQYVGNDSEKMLNLQDIVENLGKTCQGKAWIVVTSQEDIDKAIGEIKQSMANDFSKIIGRFHTKIKLSSTNSDEVIKKRVLNKTPASSKELVSLYNEKDSILKNIFSFTQEGATQDFYAGVHDFMLSYPFGAYQFTMLQKVYSNIRQIGATGKHLSSGERSMLGGFQEAAQSVADKNIGQIVPFYQFYECIDNYLDTSVRNSIIEASKTSTLNDFDVKLLKLLFLIKNLEKEIPPSVDNLATLCVDHIDVDKLQLKKQIQDSLYRLDKENHVQRDGDKYYFLTNEEQEINREIKKAEIKANSQSDFLLKTIFSDIIKTQGKYRYPYNKNDYEICLKCDGLSKTAKSASLFFEICSPFCDSYIEMNDAKCVMQTTSESLVLLKLKDDKVLNDEITQYLQTEAFLNKKGVHNVKASVKKILDSLGDQNVERKHRIESALTQLLLDSQVFISGRNWQPPGRADSPKSIFESALEYLVKNTYKKLDLIQNTTEFPEKEILSYLRQQTGGDQIPINIQAHEEILMFVKTKRSQSNTPILSDIVEHFSKHSYGWPEWETTMMTARLLKHGKISMTCDGNPVGTDQAGELLTKRMQWNRIKVTPREKVDELKLNATKKLAQDIFGKTYLDKSEDELVGVFKQNFAKTCDDIKGHLRLSGIYPGKNVLEKGQELLSQITNLNDDPVIFYRLLSEKQNDILDFFDDYRDIHSFYTNSTGLWDKINQALNELTPNKRYLTNANELESLSAIFQSQSPYARLKDAQGFISKLETEWKEVLQQAQSTAKAALENIYAEFVQQLDGLKGITDTIKNQVTEPLLKLKQDIENSINIAELKTLPEEALKKAEECLAKALEEVQKITGQPEPKGQKEIKNFKVSSIVTLGEYLESKEDIETFIQRLKTSLLEQINEKTRIKLL